MGEDDEPPYEGEQKPGEDKGEGEHEQRPAPLGVHEGGEDVLQVSAPALGHVPLDNVAVSVFEDDALFHASGSVAGLTVSGTDTFHVKYIYILYYAKISEQMDSKISPKSAFSK